MLFRGYRQALGENEILFAIAPNGKVFKSERHPVSNKFFDNRYPFTGTKLTAEYVELNYEFIGNYVQGV